MLKKIDIYIIKKFLGTFAFSIFAFIWILIIFDLSEKVGNFIDKEVPLNAILFEYYLNFVPYFINMLSPLFIFISVILFTSKLAANTEIIAILSTGISFRRLMRPYLFSAIVLAILSFTLNNYIIPSANKRRLAFQERYLFVPLQNWDKNIHKQIAKGVYIYMESYSVNDNIGYQFSMEKFKDRRLENKLISDFIKWDSTNSKWTIHNYRIRYFEKDNKERIVKGNKIDTVLPIRPADFKERDEIVETMNLNELNAFIDKKKLQGESKVQALLVAKYQRMASPFAAFILTLIGVSLSSRKVRGGIGVNIGIGLLISASYILFMQISTNFAISSSLSPLLAVWIPNILYSIIGIYLYIRAPK